MLNLTQRNLKIFFRQKSAVFFSFLGVLIIIALYVLFLGDVWSNYIDIPLPETNTLMNNWIIAGIVSVTSITTTMGAFSIMVEDKVRKNSKDFYASPIKRSKIVSGYILSAYVIGVIMSLFAFALGEIYIVMRGGTLLPLLSTLKVLGILLIAVMMSSALIFFIISFFESSSAFSTASTIIGTLVGFLTGIYLPIGTMPESVQWVIKLFPVSHAAALLRQVMMETAIATSFTNIPDSYLSDFKTLMGITYTYGQYSATATTHIVFLVATTLLFFGLALLNVSRKKK